MPRVLYALERAKTAECKDEILNNACHLKVANSLDEYYSLKRLETQCPFIKKVKGKLFGCVKRNKMKIEMDNILEAKIHFNFYMNESIYNANVCNDVCLSIDGYKYSAFNYEEGQFGYRRFVCICIEKLFDTSIYIKDESCQTYSAEYFYIHETGLYGNIH
jgi:hypothetical protein